MEDEKLKEFMINNLDFKSLKEIGFFKDVMKTDYEAQAERVCRFFNLDSVYDYKKIGEGTRYHLSVIATEFDCPICSCKNDVPKDEPNYDFKCVGCKRNLNANFNGAGYTITSKDEFQDKTKTTTDEPFINQL